MNACIQEYSSDKDCRKYKTYDQIDGSGSWTQYDAGGNPIDSGSWS